MSIIGKAVQHKTEERKASTTLMPDRKVVNERYGINNLFAQKSKKLSFMEFRDGIKDIFLAIPISVVKLISNLYSILKRPASVVFIFFIVIILLVVNSFSRPVEQKKKQHIASKNVVAIQNSAFQNISPVSQAKKTMISDLDEHIALDSAKINAAKDNFEEAAKIIGRKKEAASNSLTAPANILATIGKKTPSPKFEAKVNDFFAEHKVSDIIRMNGGCRLKLENGIFSERSTICEDPKIILDSSTEEDIIFSDGVSNFCAIKIYDLLQ